jgi:Raf kinase inhibitor-like YbhB/YbcL family protein
MKIESTAFKNNKLIPKIYTCDGENINPPLLISDVPENAKSLVLIVDDPDAPAGTWVHWTIWNLDPKVSEIPENSVPEGSVEGMTDSGRSGYSGPCPPSGTHRYFFKIYALDTMLDLSPSVRATDIEKEMEASILTEAQLVGLYRRQ